MIKEIEVNSEDTITEVRKFNGLGKEWRYLHKSMGMMVFEKEVI